MTQFKRGDKVATKSGALILGIVGDVGHRLMGVLRDDGDRYQYDALETSNLRLQTPAEQRGLKIGDTVIVGVGRKCGHGFNVGQAAVFFRDDGTDCPKFIQNGETQYLDLSEITTAVKSEKSETVAAPRAPVTPSQAMDLKVGDEVVVKAEAKSSYGFRGRVFLHIDDATRIPRFRDQYGYEHYVSLENITKAPAGPAPGVLWSQAPVGATHYSTHRDHGSKWHKLDENGNWHYANNDRDSTTTFHPYSDAEYAKVPTQVAIPGITVEVNPFGSVFAAVQALEAEVRGKLQEVETLQRDVARLNGEKQTKLAYLSLAGYTVLGGKLVKTPLPVVAPKVEESHRTWKTGDTVVCIGTLGGSPAVLTVGREYKVQVTASGSVAVIDDEGDAMLRCVTNGCFKLVRRAEDLSKAPVSTWKAGDSIEALSNGIDIHVGRVYTLTDDFAYADALRFRDSKGDQRQRGDVHNYKLVARK